MKPAAYLLLYSPLVKEHLEAIESRYYTLIREQTEQQWSFEPLVVTRNRKPVRQPAALDAEWELRFGPDNRFRVFYGVDAIRRNVTIVAVGVKLRNRLLSGGEEVKL